MRAVDDLLWIRMPARCRPGTDDASELWRRDDDDETVDRVGTAGYTPSGPVDHSSFLVLTTFLPR